MRIGTLIRSIVRFRPLGAILRHGNASICPLSQREDYNTMAYGNFGLYFGEFLFQVGGFNGGCDFR